MGADYDAVVILACGINEDGTLPDDPKASVGIGADLYNVGKTPLLIMSGNLSYKANFRPPISESEAMYAYAQEVGIPAEALLVENDSKDTLGNAYFTKVNFLIPRNLDRIAVVLGPNHSLERVQYIFDKVLGDKFTATYLEHNTHRIEGAEREKWSLTILKEWLNSIPDGDHDAVYQAMLEKHPGYSPNPEKAWRELNQRMDELQL